MLCADHGPCVSGAHNSIVTSRAGKDLVSSLVSGLLTIGPRFGGAIDDAARYALTMLCIAGCCRWLVSIFHPARMHLGILVSNMHWHTCKCIICMSVVP